MKSFLTTAILATASCSALQAQHSLDHTTGIYVTGGTTGIGLGLTQKVAEHWTVRAEYSSYSLSRSITDSDLRYDGTFKLRSAALFGDFRPFAGAFRITGGFSVLTPKVDAIATSSTGTYTINGTAYPAAGEYIKGSVKYPSVMPYLGIGWGYRASGQKGLLAGLDLGAFIGKPKVALTYSPGLIAAVPQADRDAEVRDFKDEVARISYFPVIKIGIGYAF